MKRIELGKNVRISVTVVLTIVSVVYLLVLYQAYKTPDTIDRETVITKYSQSSNFGYTVNLNSNKLYDTNTIVGTSPNQTYFAKIVKDVSTAFAYKFMSSEEGTNVQGNYDITAILSTDNWEKRYVLVPNKEFSGIDKIDFAEVSTVDINYYNNILANITKEIDVQPKDSKLMLVYNINIVITKDGKETKESFVPIILITSTKGAFNIKGDITKKSDGAIKKVEREVRLDVLEKRVNSMTIVIVVILVTLIFFVVTKSRKEEVNEKEKREKKVQDIKKKYGDLIVLSKEPNLPYEKVCHRIVVESIDDLVKAAEQLDEPIINSDYLYYVYDGSSVYIYDTRI